MNNKSAIFTYIFLTLYYILFIPALVWICFGLYLGGIVILAVYTLGWYILNTNKNI